MYLVLILLVITYSPPVDLEVAHMVSYTLNLYHKFYLYNAFILLIYALKMLVSRLIILAQPVMAMVKFLNL